MQTTTSSQTANGERRSPARIIIVLIGYLLALVGAFSFFSVWMLLMPVGVVIVAFTSRAAPPMTWRSWLVLILGFVVILGLLNLFGEEQVRLWRPHPGGYVVAWLACFQVFRHLRLLLSHHDPVPNSAV